MNRSNSKIRHIQEANLKLEQAFVDSYFERDKAPDWVTNRFKETKPKVKTKPKTKSEIINFQNWVINTKKDKQILGKSGADGIWGQRSELAWNRYGVDYVPTKATVNSDPKKIFKTFDDVRKFQNWVINVKKDRKLIGSADGDWGPKTKSAWNKYGAEYVKSKVNTDTKVDNKNRCVALSKEECSKISPNKETTISTGSETRCSAYMVKCLSQYDSELFGGNAWNVFNNVKGQGKVKYNAYTDGSVNWNYIYSQLKKNKIGKDLCSKYAKVDDADKIYKSPLPNIISNSVPSSSKINISSLELGDIVGLYHSGSSNKGMAFCQRALNKNLDNDGNINKDPFTFNSHVGFVGAIKNGIPIIIHNIHGKHTATPATKMLSKTSSDMIVWVVSDNDVRNAIAKEEGKSNSGGSSWFNMFESEKKNDLNEIIDDESFKDESIIKPKNKYPCLNNELSLAVDYTISNNVNKFFIKYAIGILKRESDFGYGKRYMGKAPFEYVINKLSDLIPGFGSMIKWGAKKIFGKPNWVPSMGIAQMTPDIAKKYGVSLESLMVYSGSLMGASKYLADLYSQAKQRYSTNSPTNIIQNGKLVVNPNSTGNAALDIAIMSYNMGYGKFNKKYCKTNNPKFMGPCDSPNGKYKPYEKQYPKFVLTVDKTKVIKDYAPKLSYGKLTNLGYLKEVNEYVKKINCIK